MKTYLRTECWALQHDRRVSEFLDEAVLSLNSWGTNKYRKRRAIEALTRIGNLGDLVTIEPIPRRG